MRGGEGICIVMRTVRSLEFLITGFAGGGEGGDTQAAPLDPPLYHYLQIAFCVSLSAVPVKKSALSVAECAFPVAESAYPVAKSAFPVAAESAACAAHKKKKLAKV